MTHDPRPSKTHDPRPRPKTQDQGPRHISRLTTQGLNRTAAQPYVDLVAATTSATWRCPVAGGRANFVGVFVFNILQTPSKQSPAKNCPRDCCATVSRRCFGVCAGSKVRFAPTDDPATVLYAPRAAWFVIRTIRAFATTRAYPDPQCALRCSAARARRRREPRLIGQTHSYPPDSF